VTGTGLELMIFQHQLSKCWDYGVHHNAQAFIPFLRAQILNSCGFFDFKQFEEPVSWDVARR
jgi:hypothetical protein